MRRYSDRGVLGTIPIRIIVAAVATLLLIPFAFGWIGFSDDSESPENSDQSASANSVPEIESDLSVTENSLLSEEGASSAAVVLDPSWYPKGISRYDAEGVIFGSTTETTEAPQTTSVGADPRTQPTSAPTSIEETNSGEDASSETLPQTTQPSGGGTTNPSPTTTRPATTTTKAPPKTTTTKATTTTQPATSTTAAAIAQTPSDP